MDPRDASTVGLRFLVADSRTISRELLYQHLHSCYGGDLVTSVGDGIAALETLALSAIDILITRPTLLGLDGISLVEELTARRSFTRSIILGQHISGQLELLRALRAGARGYLTPVDSLDELKPAIETVARNNLYISERALAGRDVLELLTEARQLHRTPLERLTLRERQMLGLISEGLTSREAAVRLSISIHTADGHRASLMSKTRSHTAVDLVTWLRTAENADDDAPNEVVGSHAGRLARIGLVRDWKN